MSQVETRLALFRLALAKDGRRLTSEKERAARAIFDLPQPADPEVVLSELERRYGPRQISRATVYRVLHQLKAAGLL